MTSGARSFHVCQSCGYRSPKWLGRCPECGEWNSLVEERGRAAGLPAATAVALPLPEVDRESVARLPSGNVEFDRVLGGGIVPGSLVLLGGEPGIGKSTLLLQIGESLSRAGHRVLYVSGEESVEQIKLRSERLAIRGEHLFLAAETSVEQILAETSRLQPELLIVDSIQTMHTRALDSIPGSIGQIRDSAAQLLAVAKRDRVPVVLIGHVTKQGSLAGPKVLEHLVDTVLYFEGDRHHNQKIIRAVKNRFGPANELGIFQMTRGGLVCVENPSRLFLAERGDPVSGSVVHAAMEGSRPVLVEVQALVSQANLSGARRMANGIDRNRLSLLLAMLEKRAGLAVLGSDVYVNVAGGLNLVEPAVDLATVAAVISNFLDRPVKAGCVIFGEVGLGGEVRAVSSAWTRVREALSLGFESALLPRSNLPLSEPAEGIRLEGVSSVPDLLDLLFD